MEDHDNNKEDWTESSVSFAAVALVMVFTTPFMVFFTLSLSSLSVMLSTSMVFSAEHTHEGWLFLVFFLVLNDFFFLTKVAALEDTGWEFFGHIDSSASWLDGSTDAPGALRGIGVAFVG